MVQKIGNAVASPTKAFFVRMLTRDIELEDAILDLLDNCVDGILRSGGVNSKSRRPYKGFWARITMSQDRFEIEDNCGGIPFEVAKRYAFAIGRPSGATAMEAGNTVGLYGIGMKRAIFKMGQDAIVESRHDRGFSVEFTSAWMDSDDWSSLPMRPLATSTLRGKGTRVVIRKLRDEASSSFADANWVDNFKRIVERHYSLIIQKGFEVRIGSPAEMSRPSAVISPTVFSLLRSEDLQIGEVGIAPYVYRGHLRGVDVEIYAGLYRPLLNEEEQEDEEDRKITSDDAGWTVVCNDRVVIWKDKTRLTGWGESPVPHFHGQFIAISGIVLLRSSDPKKLPLTTTKRGVDAGSDIYLDVKELMREATKALTSFTNKWKKFPEHLKEIYQSSAYMSLPEVRAWAASIPLVRVRNMEGIEKFEPDYPEPEQEKTSARVSFVAMLKDIAKLRHRYFGEDSKAKAGVVGQRAFDDAVKGHGKRPRK